MTRQIVVVLCLAAMPVFGAAQDEGESRARSVPVIYSTDLYHPHQDPDDHFDLATLFSIPEFDIRALVFDLGPVGKGRPGLPALRQMMHLTGRDVPYALGLTDVLRSRDDRAEDRPDAEQAGIALILKALRESDKPVTIITAGSLRDVAAAYNREPELMKRKVARLYINIGHSGGGEEWNVKLDPHAYVRIMRSGLPVYWAPCFGTDGYQTLWKFRQGDVLADAPAGVQNYILYALAKKSAEKEDPVAYLSGTPSRELQEQFWKRDRNMWCTGPFLDAAGHRNDTFSFRTVNVGVEDDGRSQIVPEDKGIPIKTFFRENADDYTAAMTTALRNLLSQLGRKP